MAVGPGPLRLGGAGRTREDVQRPRLRQLTRQPAAVDDSRDAAQLLPPPTRLLLDAEHDVEPPTEGVQVDGDDRMSGLRSADGQHRCERGGADPT